MSTNRYTYFSPSAASRFKPSNFVHELSSSGFQFSSTYDRFTNTEAGNLIIESGREYLFDNEGLSVLDVLPSLLEENVSVGTECTDGIMAACLQYYASVIPHLLLIYSGRQFRGLSERDKSKYELMFFRLAKGTNSGYIINASDPKDFFGQTLFIDAEGMVIDVEKSSKYGSKLDSVWTNQLQGAILRDTQNVFTTEETIHGFVKHRLSS